MNKISINFKENQDSWISTTGYRTLLILTSLLEKERSIDELVEILKNNKITNKSVSKDTVRLTINTLKTAGCSISRPTKANGYKYVIEKHPFCLNISSRDLKVLLKVHESFCKELSWKEVVSLNNVLLKVISLTENKQLINIAKNSIPFSDINLNILYQLDNPSIYGKKVKIKYSSPKFGKEDLDIIPQKIYYENEKLYLQCYSYKYKNIAVLNISRILGIKNINISEEFKFNDFYEVIYEIFSEAMIAFEPDNNEEIIYKDNNKIRIKAKVLNEFWFIQKIFLFGNNFKIISPDFFREKLIDKIKQIKKEYEK